MKIPDKLAFWRWPRIMAQQAAEIERLKAEHLKTLTAQSAILEWVKITHRLDSPAEGIRALIQSGKRLVPALVLLLGLQCALGQNPPVLRNSWSTNLAGTPVRGLNNLSVTNMGSGTNWLFYGITPQTVARLVDITGASGLTNLFSLSLSNASSKPIVFGGLGTAAGMTNVTGQLYGLQAGASITLTPNGSNIVIASTASGTGITTNANQFGPSVQLTIKDGAFLTNLIVETSLKVSNGFVYFDGPVTNNTQFNLPHLTVSRSAIINAQGDLTNSSADSNWSLYPTNIWNDRQFGSANLTNWSLIPTGAMANVASTTFLTNWANSISNLAQTKQANVWTNDGFLTMPYGARTNASPLYIRDSDGSIFVGTNVGSPVWFDFSDFTEGRALVRLSEIDSNEPPQLRLELDVTDSISNLTYLSGVAYVVHGSPLSTVAGMATLEFYSAGSSGHNAAIGLRTFNDGQTQIECATNGASLFRVYSGDITRVRGIAYSWPGAQGAAQSVFTNDGSGNLGWLSLLIFQPASANLTNWSLIPTGAMANVVSTTFLTNWANAISNLAQTKQFGSATLTNLSGTGAVTNLFSLSLSNATIKPVVFGGVGTAAGMTNTTGQLYGLEAGSSITLTPNGSNIVIASTASGAGLTTNANQFLGVPLSIKSGALLTNTAFHGGITMTNSDSQEQVLRVDSTATTNALSVGSNGIVSIKGSAKVINIGETTSAGFTGFGLADTSPGAPSIAASSGLFSDTGNVLFNYPGGGAGDFFITAGGNHKVSVGRGGTDGFVGIGNGVETSLALLSVGSGSKFQVDAAGSVRTHGSITITNIPGQSPPVLSLMQTNGRGMTAFATTNSVIATNFFVFSFSSNNVAAGDLFTVHSTTISAGTNTIVVTNSAGSLFQPASANLTNWSLIPTGAMANVLSTTFLTNWANAISNLAETKQLGSATLTNLSGTGAVTNLFSLSLSNATLKPVVFGGVGTAAAMTNTTGQLYGLEAGANITLTPNGSNIVLASTGGGSVTFADLLWTNEPGRRIHPTSFTNRVEVQWPITVGTNTQTFSGAPNSNDIFFAYRDVTKGEKWDPQFALGVFSNSVFSSASFALSHGFSAMNLSMQDENNNSSYARIDSGDILQIKLSTTNGYVPFASEFITNTTLQNVTYQFPPSQGSAGTVLTNNGSGALGWGTVAGSGPAALTNLFAPSLSNATIKPIVFGGVGDAAGMTNVTGQVYGLEAGANMTLTPNGSNILVAASGSGLSYSDLIWTNSNGSIYPVAFPTNIVFNPTNAGPASDPDLERNLTNFVFRTSTRRTGGTNKLFTVWNGNAGAFLISDQGIMIGSTNFIPVPTMAIDIAYDTAFGVDTPIKTITMSSYNSAVGYSGNAEFGVSTNLGRMQLLANKEGNGQIQLDEKVGGDANFINYDLKLLVINANNTIIFPYQIDPDFSLGPTGYTFGSTMRITNTDMLMSLQNSNFPVFEVDGVGDIRKIKKIAYLWPSSQGSDQSVLTNNGSGSLGWSTSLPNIQSVDYLTNWANAISNYANTKQFGTATLTNLSGTGAITNLYNLSLSNATIKPTVFGGIGTAAAMTNTTGQLYGLEAGGNVVLTPNGSNITIQATLSGGGYATNANQFGAQITLTLKDGIFLTNIIAFPSSSGVNPGLTVTNLPGIGTNSFQVLNTNGVPVIFAATNNGVTLVASNLAILGTQTNTSSLNVLGGVTNWAGVETRGNATNAGWLAIAGGFTNIGGTLHVGSVTNGGRMDTGGGVTNWSSTEAKGTLYASSNLWVKAGQGTSNAWVGGRIFIDASTQTTNHSGAAAYTNLFTCTVSGNTLTNTGDELEFYLAGMMRLGLANTNGFKCIYGSQTVFDTGLITVSNCPWAATIKITRTGLSAQRVEAKVLWNVSLAASSAGNGVLSSYATNLTAAQANGATNIFVFQGQSRVAAALTNDYRVISYWPGLN